MFTKKIRIIKNKTATIRYAVVPWDSKILQNTTIEIEKVSASSVIQLTRLLSHLVKTCSLRKGDLLVYKIPLQDYAKNIWLYQAGFYFIEQTVTITVDATKWNPLAFNVSKNDAYRLAPAHKSDLMAIQKIAGETFVADRFHMDFKISNTKASRRYEKWIENSFSSSDSVYKYIDKANTIIGFFIINQQKQYTELRLAGLDPKYQGQGLGKALYYSMFRLLKKRKQKTLKAIVSLNNIAVLNVYLYLGCAKFSDSFVVFHKII